MKKQWITLAIALIFLTSCGADTHKQTRKIAVDGKKNENRSFKMNLQKKIKKNTPPEWMQQRVQDEFEMYTRNLSKFTPAEKIMENDLTRKGNLQLVRVKIKNNCLSMTTTKKETQENPRFSSMEHFISKLLKYAKVPDADFVMTLHDSLNLSNLPGPIFMYAKSRNNKEGILIPDCDALGGNSQFLTQVETAKKSFPWENKIDKAIWRGAMTGVIFTKENFLRYPRSQCVSLSLNHPEIIDARFSSINQCENEEDIKNHYSSYISEPISVENHLRYKYQILIDGNSCAYSRYYWQLFSNSVIFKHESSDIQWFYDALRPFVHYIPCKNDLSDLVEKIEWAKKNDSIVQSIIFNANEFAKNNLRREDSYYYLYLAIKEHAKLENNYNNKY